MKLMRELTLLLFFAALTTCTGQPNCGRFQIIYGSIMAPSGAGVQANMFVRMDTETGRTWYWDGNMGGWLPVKDAWPKGQ